MIKKLYVVYDVKAETMIGPVLAEPRDAPAVRTFTDALKDQNSLGRHAEDYNLLYVGDIDEKGQITLPVTNAPTVVLAGALWANLQQIQQIEAQNG